MTVQEMTVRELASSLQQASFLTSAAKVSQCPADTGFEVAFCGRSNAGKSSCLNYLTSQRKLARTSKTPGRTQLINFFQVGTLFRLVDLPGYGYAKVPTAMKDAWHQQIDAYLRERKSLLGLIMVMDIRHPLKEFDQMMVNWASEAGVPGHIVLTKADKLKRGAQNNTLFAVRKELPEGITAQVLSSTHDQGKDVLVKTLMNWLQTTTEVQEDLSEGASEDGNGDLSEEGTEEQDQ